MRWVVKADAGVQISSSPLYGEQNSGGLNDKSEIKSEPNALLRYSDKTVYNFTADSYPGLFTAKTWTHRIFIDGDFIVYRQLRPVFQIYRISKAD